MSKHDPIERVVSTLNDLRFQLSNAQQGSMDPLLRSELARLAFAAEKCVGGLAESNAQANAQLIAKKQHVAQLAEANTQAIAEKKAAAAASPQKPDERTPAPSIDPTLRTRLTAELLARQPQGELDPDAAPRAGLIDDWPWRPTGLVAESQLAPHERIGPATAAERR